MRCALGAIVLWPLIKLRKRIQEMLGKGTSNWFVFITVSQFHFLFYLSRPLPNTMALPLGKVLFYLRRTIEHSFTSGAFTICSAASLLLLAWPAAREVYRLFSGCYSHLPRRIGHPSWLDIAGWIIDPAPVFSQVCNTILLLNEWTTNTLKFFPLELWFLLCLLDSSGWV